MKAIITRPCEYRGHSYVLGEPVYGEDAAKLVRLRFAGWDESEPVPAPSPPPQTGHTDYEPSEHTADEVRQYGEDHPTEASALIAKETSGKNRATVIASLNAILNDHQGG